MKTIISMRINGERWQVVNYNLKENVTSDKSPGLEDTNFPFRIYRNRKMYKFYKTLSEAMNDFNRIAYNVVFSYK